MEHRYINDIKVGEQVDGIYLVREPILRSTTNGGLYIAMYLSDKTGELNGRMWQATEDAYNKLPKPGFIRVQGRSEMYKDNIQVVVNKFDAVDVADVNVTDFLARTDKDRRVLFSEVKEILATIENAGVKALVDEFTGDKELMKRFCDCPAAVKMHHNYIGGLLEHTHNMLQVANSILGFYPKVQRDLVLAGIFFHDMGKTEELEYELAFSYTDSGQLIGHITKSFVMMMKKAESLASGGQPIDEVVLDSLGHIILSHHGEYEFGSPKLPATAEAFMVNYIDDLDAKMCQVTSLVDNEPGESNWTGWQNSLQTRIYRKRIEQD